MKQVILDPRDLWLLNEALSAPKTSCCLNQLKFGMMTKMELQTKNLVFGAYFLGTLGTLGTKVGTKENCRQIYIIGPR